MTVKDKESIDLVKQAVMTYVEGVVNFEFEKGLSPWHEKGVKITYEDSDLIFRTIGQTKPDLTEDQIPQFMKRITQQGAIMSVDVTGNAAYVKLVWDFEMDGESKIITDYILLLNIEGYWKIVGKVFNEKAVE